MEKAIYIEYICFVEHAKDIIGYGNWHYNCKKAFNDFNEWLEAAELRAITQPEMCLLESFYMERNRKGKNNTLGIKF